MAHLTSVHEALGSIPSTANKENGQRLRIYGEVVMPPGNKQEIYMYFPHLIFITTPDYRSTLHQWQ